MAAKNLSEGDIPGVTSSSSTAASFCPAQLVTYFYTQLEMEPRTFRTVGLERAQLRALAAPVCRRLECSS